MGVMDKFRLDGKVAWITDASYGLDPELVKGALAGVKFDEIFFADAKNEELKALW